MCISFEAKIFSVCLGHLQIKTMEDMLGNSETQRELIALRHTLELLEEEKKECSNKCSKAELEVKDLRFTGEVEQYWKGALWRMETALTVWRARCVCGGFHRRTDLKCDLEILCVAFASLEDY